MLKQKRDVPQAPRCQRTLALELDWSALDCFSCDDGSFHCIHCGWHGLDCSFCLNLLILLPVVSMVLRTIVQIFPALSPRTMWICPTWMIAADAIVIRSFDRLVPGTSTSTFTPRCHARGLSHFLCLHVKLRGGHCLLSHRSSNGQSFIARTTMTLAIMFRASLLFGRPTVSRCQI